MENISKVLFEKYKYRRGNDFLKNNRQGLTVSRRKEEKSDEK
ncbi:hypothetical protein [Murimonas intestini]|nr:hypothetical protein [Murimonas intestini]MCR1842879.1 hypothetical protein [Murimonas intestini]